MTLVVIMRDLCLNEKLVWTLLLSWTVYRWPWKGCCHLQSDTPLAHTAPQPTHPVVAVPALHSGVVTYKENTALEKATAQSHGNTILAGKIWRCNGIKRWIPPNSNIYLSMAAHNVLTSIFCLFCPDFFFFFLGRVSKKDIQNMKWVEHW